LFLKEIRQAAEFLDLPELLVFVTNIQAHEEFLNTDLKQRYRKVRTATFTGNSVHTNLNGVRCH